MRKNNYRIRINLDMWITSEDKAILDDINGDFRAGELTAIMGPSGAGKSSLMDILAGYTTANVYGRVTVNGRERDLRRFRRQTAYIMQDHNLQPVLTVWEAMHFSANLKIGNEMSANKKRTRIRQILEAIALYEVRKTRTVKLSGGQKKRLAIALELVNNPPIMFFDEPTSGLDSSTSTQCVSILKQLAQEGRTIICTIHQPSALVFRMFDHLYAIAEGKCIYTGSVQNVVPFLMELDLKCPEFYNPSDYLLEISTNDYGMQNERLVAKSQNGMTCTYRSQKSRNSTQIAAMTKVEQMMANGLITPVRAPSLAHSSKVPPTPVMDLMQMKPKKAGLKIDPTKCCKRDDRYPTTFLRQFYIILLRSFLILWRDRSLTAMRVCIHLFVAPVIGVLYFGIGNDGYHTYNNYKYAFFSIMFLMYTAFSSIILVFPLELPIIKREHFNRWYSLKAYYVAMTLADVPVQVVCVFLYTIITYLMTAQPLEIQRYALFSFTCLVVCFVAQSIGLLIGSLFSVKNGAIFGPFVICPFLIFSGFFIHLADAHPFMHWLFHISFLKYALEGASLALFGFNRPKMECEKIFCQFVLPEKFMKTINMNDVNYWFILGAMATIFLFFRITTYYVMLYRLRHKS
ncbi:ATP-binding cassette sub-family G member 4 isoform X2 [Lutzomyia longipalpis]|uniref:ATP-binding cassette sub-family G member 4 isoform X2 n=1 Tax=Lutzomyia longipalpis TaxID=7200 RepID=UPI0024838011|nr:ATP-binding cassette sub-family G member 4 isoform X2 [Lutzomyia longipalpis]